MLVGYATHSKVPGARKRPVQRQKKEVIQAGLSQLSANAPQ